MSDAPSGKLRDGPISMSFEELIAWHFTRICIVRRCRARFGITPTLQQMLGIDSVKCPECDTPQLINDNAEIAAGLRNLLWRIEKLEAAQKAKEGSPDD